MPLQLYYRQTSKTGILHTLLQAAVTRSWGTRRFLSPCLLAHDTQPISVGCFHPHTVTIWFPQLTQKIPPEILTIPPENPHSPADPKSMDLSLPQISGFPPHVSLGWKVPPCGDSSKSPWIRYKLHPHHCQGGCDTYVCWSWFLPNGFLKWHPMNH